MCKALRFSLGLVSIFSFSACDRPTDPALADSQFATYIVKPGAVEDFIEPGRGPVVTGSVMLTRTYGEGFGSVTGGGCLIYRSAQDQTPTCSTQSDCQIIVNNKVLKGGYCASASNDPNSENVCWHQPLMPSCIKKPGPKDEKTATEEDWLDNSLLPAGRPKSFDLPTPQIPPGEGGLIYWRVASCQNLVKFGCRFSRNDKDRHLEFGEIVTLPRAPSPNEPFPPDFEPNRTIE